MTEDADFVPHHGEVAGFIRQRDWSASSLGPMHTWPGSLRTVLRLMLSSRYAMWMGYGKDLTFFYNDAYAHETLGPKHPWALGQSATAVWAEIWDQIGPRIEHVLTTGEATYDEGLLLFLERNGYPEETYHSFSYSPVPGDAAGEIAGMFCVVVEETGRVLNERRLAFLRDLSAALAATKTPEGVFSAVEAALQTRTKDFPFSFVYPISEDGSGVPAPWGVPTSRVPVSVVLDAKDEWPRGAWDIAPTHALVVPIPHQGRSGVVAVIVVGLNPHRPYDDEMRGFVDLFAGQIAASFANARAYREQIQRAEQLTELDRAKTAFFSNVSHEFRTPLTLMLGPTQDALASPERALSGAQLETVHRNELRLLKLVNALLDFARIEAGRTQAAYEPTDLCTFTTDLSSAFRSAIERAGLSFEVSCSQLPEPIYVDHDMWEKIVLNLLSNALKFTFEGVISVSLDWRDDHAIMVIRDTGIGVAPEELPRLFERFHRIEGSRARTHEGSGIGLALVHDLVKLHRGTISVTSEVGKGTAFTISVPSGQAHLPDHQLGKTSQAHASMGAAFVEEAMRWLPATSAAPTPREGGVEHASRVLVADDNGDMREYIARILGQHFEVETVGDGASALAAMRRRMPDLVVSDVMMPRVDGFELVRQVRADSTLAALPVILLSARAGEDATAEGLRSGADDYLVKPFSAGALLVRVEAQLSAARLRRTLRENAEAERKRLQLLFDESPAGIAIFRGRELVIDHANPMILEIWGKSATVVGQPLLLAVPELRGQGFDALLHGVQDSQIAYHGREVLAKLDRGGRGEIGDYYFDFVYAPLRGAEDLDAVVVHAFDVTDKVLARRHLEQLRELAESANRVKDEFLATMSHELRTPLNAILGWAALLRTQSEPDWSRTERGLATIERNARSQARLIEDVLDVSRIISGKLRLEMATTDLVQVSLAAVDVVRPAAVAKAVDLALEIEDETPIELVGDSDRLQQVVWNLLSNAVKFTPSDGRVTLVIRKVGRDAELVVRDSGSGIPSEHLPYVFDRFRQVDSSSTRKYGGLGLGLAIVRHLVELHGGAVSAESEGEGRGAMFTIRLPMRAVTESVRPPPRSQDSSPLSTKKESVAVLAGVRVLVVDDDEDSRLLLDSALSLAGATVQTADSARMALEALDTRTIDILISDIGMPEEDGYSFIQRVRARPANLGGDVPAIALTAYASAADVARAERAGFQKHVAKPTDLRAIVAAVASLAKVPRRAG